MENTHINEFDTFLNIVNLDEKIKNPNNTSFKFNSITTNTITEKRVEISTMSKVRINKNKKNLNTENINYSEQNNVLLVFQNNEKFVKLIKLIAKPIKPSIYIYTENDDIIVIISSANYYPIIISRFTIQEPMIYVKPGIKLCFKFPYIPFLNFISQQDRTNLNFTILLTHENNQIEIEFHNSNHTMIKKIPNFEVKNKEIMINEVFMNKIVNPNYTQFDNLRMEDIDYINKLRTMKILFLKEVKENANFTKHLKDKTSHIIDIREDKIIMEITVNKTVTKLILYDEAKYKKDDADMVEDKENENIKGPKYDKIKNKNLNVLYWNDEFKNKKLQLIKYINIFKHIDKLPNMNDMIYYGICKWDILPSTYIFIKISTNKNVKDYFNKTNKIDLDNDFNNLVLNDAPLFGNIFSDSDYVCEFILALEN